MEGSLRKKAFWGIIWSYIGRFGSQIVSIIPAMILARLLGPEQYGLIAMAGIFTNIAYQLADGGFGNALVQKKNADNLDYSTIFYFNLFICGFIYALIFFCAVPIALFFHEPLLIPIIRISSLGIIIGACGQIQTLIFKKELNYKSQVIRNLICQIISVIIAIVMAYDGWGVWALVAQGLASITGTVIINWIISSWRPIFKFSIVRLRGLFKFGSKTLASSLIDYGFNKAYDILIGRVYNPVSLGLYNRAYSTADIFKSTFFGVFSSVTFPVFVQMQDDNERLVNNIRKFIQIVSMVIFTAMGTVIILSTPIFQFMYSSKWDAAINLFCVACIIAMVTPIVSILESIILAKGHSGKFLLISIIRKIFVIIVIASVWKEGVMWLMIGQAMVSVCECCIYTVVTKKIVDYTFSKLLSDVIPSIIIAAVVSGIVMLENSLLTNICGPGSESNLAMYLSQIFIGVSTALLSFFIICKTFKVKAYHELIQFIEDSIGPKRILNLLKCK